MPKLTIDPTLNYPEFRELSADEKDRVLVLLLDHLGLEVEVYKFDGTHVRSIALQPRRVHR